MAEKSNNSISRGAMISVLGVVASASMVVGSIKSYFVPTAPAPSQTVQIENQPLQYSGGAEAQGSILEIQGKRYQKAPRAQSFKHEGSSRDRNAQSLSMTDNGASLSSDTQSLNMVGEGTSMTRAQLNELKAQRRAALQNR